MKYLKQYSLIAVSLFLTVFTTSSFASNYYYPKQRLVEVTITNLTYNQVFSPPLAVNHRRNIALFEAGEPASDGIATMAEGGDVSVILSSLEGNRSVYGTATADGPVMPGKSTTFTLETNRYGRLSTVAMLVNTNDAFLALDTVYVPHRRGHTVTYYANAYDAGSEINDELCSNIPGPACGGEGVSAADGEGFVHIHRGMHGIGNLTASEYDWRNPVAKITIKRL